MNNKTLVVGLIIFSLLISSLIMRNGDIAWMILPFLAYLGMGILRAPTLERVQINGRRILEQRRLDDKIEIDVTLSIQNLSVENVTLSFHETIQSGMQILSGDLDRLATLCQGESTELKYTFTAARGNFLWSSIRSVLSDPLGLIESEILLPASAMIQIRPRIKKFKAIPLRPSNTLHSPGSIPARFSGNGIDFFGVREYHSGDSLRWLDWRLTARHPHQFFTKEFEQEEIADIGILLDARHKTDVRIGEESLFESSVGATASLAEMFLHQGHRVSMLIFGDTMLNTFPGYGKQQLHRIMSCLSSAKVGPDNHRSINSDLLPIGIFPNHALIVIISSFSSRDRFLYLRLLASGYQVLLISPDPVDFAYPTLAQDQDIANRLAIQATRLERRLRLDNIAKLHIPVIDWQVSQPLYPLVRNALTRSRGQRLK